MENPNNVTPESYVGPVDIATPVNLENDISCPFDGPEDAEKVHDEVKPKVELAQAVFVPDTNELRQGYRILKELMADANKNVNWPFMDAVDSEATGLYDYYERVKNPIWLLKMREKFESCKYETITEFVADFRLMLENCFRYNGPDHWVSKRAQRFETMLEQKLTLLSRELRERTTIEATSGKPSDMDMLMSGGLRRRGRNISPHNSSALLNQLRREEALRGKEVRKQQILERKATQDAYAQELILWEDMLLEEPIKTQLKNMWEIPQIGLFLFLCQEPLNIGEVVQFELERSFAMTRESITLQCVMTTLLSTPYQRTRLDRKPMMPYSIWEEKLGIRLGQWYKQFTDTQNDADKAATKLGIDPYLFTVLGPKNPLDKRKFHKLSFYRKIWIVKSLCDHCLVTQDSIRDSIDCQPVEENREYILGYDAEGNTYMHFPQFCGADLRVYKQAPIPHPVMEPIILQSYDEEEEPEITTNKRKPNSSKSRIKHKKRKKVKQKPVITPTPSTRPSRLRQHIKPVLPIGQVESSSSESESDGDDVSTCMEDSSTCSSTYSVTRFRGRPYLNGRFSKDNTPEPPSFRGKIRKPRNFESRLHSYSPVFKEWGVSSKEGTPEPVSSRSKIQIDSTDKKTNRKSCRSKTSRSKSRRIKCSKAMPKDITESEMMAADNRQELDPVPFQNYSDENSGKNCDRPVKEGCNNLKTSEATNFCDNELEQLNESTDKTLGTEAVENDVISSELTKSNTPQRSQNGCESIENPDDKISIKTEPSCDSNRENENKNEVFTKQYQTTVKETKREFVDCKYSDSEDIKMETDCNDKDLTSNTCEQKDVKSELIDGDENVSSLHSLARVSNDRESPLADSGANLKMLKTEDNDIHKVINDNRDCCDTTEVKNGDIKCVKEVIKSEPCMNDDTSCISECTLQNSTSEEKEAVFINKQLIPCDNNKPPVDGCEESIKTKEKQEGIESEAGDVKSESCIENTVTELTSKVEEESEEELEEVSPEIGTFVLVADSVESLRELVEQFAEPKPVVERNKRNKNSKLPSRKKCVVELHGRLQYLLKELEPWESKLVQAAKRARLKLKKEKMDFVPEEEKKVVEDVWESEESDSEEDSSSSDEQDNNQKPDTCTKSEIKIIHVDQTEFKMATINKTSIEEDDMSTSSRGRLRKRRIIPNNGDETKKRKVLKNPEVNTSGHVPNILQRNQGVKAENTLRNFPISIIEQLKTPTLNTDPKKIALPATLSASQMLLRANLTSKNNVNSLLSSTWSIRTSDGTKVLPVETFQQLLGKGVKAGPTHPVIQQLLAQKIKLGGEMPSTYTVHIKPQQVGMTVSPIKPAQAASSVVLSSATNVNPQTLMSESPISIANQLQLAGNKSRKIEIAKARPTAVQFTSPSPGKTTSANNKVQHYNQNVLSTLPPEVIQQLLKNKSIRIQAVTPDKSNSGNLTGQIIVSQSNQTPPLIATTKPTSTLSMPTQQAPAVIRQPVPGVSQSSTVSTTPQHSGPITLAPLPYSIFGQASVTQDGLKCKPPTSPNKPKYACHVTVKSLLQDRAKKALVFNPEITSNESDDTVIVPSAAQVLSLASEVGQQLPAMLDMSSANSNSQPIVVTVNTAIKGLPQTLKLPSKETLDSAVQAVVTSVKTTLPTAHLRVPAPSTLPSIHPRKNVTRTIQSLKSPIPVVHVSPGSCQSTPLTSLAASFQTAPSFAVAQTGTTAIGLSPQPASRSPLTTLTATTGVTYQITTPNTKPIISPNSTRMISKPVIGLNQGQMNVSVSNKNENLLTVSPQTFMTSQGLVKGYLTPQGLVIPQTALQQGSPTKVIMASSNQGTLQVNAISTPNGRSLPPNSLPMPGKVVRPTMLLSDSTLVSGCIPTAQVQSRVVLNQNVTVSPVPSSKLLLQAMSSSVNNSPTLGSENMNCKKNSEPLTSKKSILSGINVKISPDKNIPMRQGIPRETTRLVSPEIQHINYKGDGIPEKKQHLTPEKLIVQPFPQRSPDNRGLPAAQVLLSLSQGVLDKTNANSSTNINMVGGNCDSGSQVFKNIPETGVSEVNRMMSAVTPLTLSANSTISASNAIGSPAHLMVPVANHGVSRANHGVSPANFVSPANLTMPPANWTMPHANQMMSSANMMMSPSKSMVSPTNQRISPANQIHNSTENTQKLLLLNIGGKLYTSQGIPVTLDNGVLKIAETISTTKQPNVPFTPGQTHTPIRQPLAQGISQQITKLPPKLVHVPVAAKGNVAQQKIVLQTVTSKVANSVPASPLKQIQVSGAQHLRQIPPSLSANLVQHGAIKQVLSQSPRILQTPSQMLTTSVSPGSVFSVPGVNQQAFQIVGLNNQQQPNLINKTNVVRMVLPNTSHGLVATGTQQVTTPVMLGALNPQVNQQGIVLSGKQSFSVDQLKAAQLLSSRLSTGQQLLSHNSVKVSVNSQPVNNFGQTVTGSQQPVFMQVVSPGIGKHVPAQFSKIISPVKHSMSPQGGAQNVVQSQSSVFSPVNSGDAKLGSPLVAVNITNTFGPLPETNSK